MPINPFRQIFTIFALGIKKLFKFMSLKFL